MTKPASTWRRPKCTSGKAAFRSQGEANRALNRIHVENLQAVAHPDHEPCRAYRCQCGAWHLTSQLVPRVKPREVEPRRRRRRATRKPSVTRALRHLSLAPEALAVPPVPAVEPAGFQPSDPISPARLALWQRNEAERVRANLEHPFPWPNRRAAA